MKNNLVKGGEKAAHTLSPLHTVERHTMNEDYEENNLTWAVFVLDSDDGQWKPISFGESEWECTTWLKCHMERPYIKGHQVVVGRVFEVTL